MSFAGLPLAAVIALALAAAGAVVALYLLKSTPRPQPVSNVDFWMKAVERANPSWISSKRIPLLAMLLTLLVTLLLVLFVADPHLSQQRSVTTVAVLDAGRSMEALSQGGEARFDQAVERLEALMNQSSHSGQIAVVRAGVRPRVLVPLTRDPHELARALEGHELDQGPSDLDEAIALADAIVSRRPPGDEGRVVVIGDRHPTTTSLGAPLTFVPVGEAAQTVAIVAFDARRDPTALGEYGLRCAVEAFAEKTARAHLTIRDGDVVLLEDDLVLEPGEAVVRTTRGFASEASELVAELDGIEVDGAEDQLAADDRAHATLQPLARTRVLLVTPGSPYLERVLEVNPSVEFDTVSPEGLDPNRAAGLYDVLVLDRVQPPPELRHPGVLLIGPPARQEGLRIGTALPQAAVTATLPGHPVLESVELEGVRFEPAQTILPEPEDRALLRSDRHVLATARDSGGRRRVVLGPALEGSNLVERPAFPLIMHNAVVWLANQQPLLRSSRPPGQPLTFGGTLALIERPTGEVAEARDGAYYDTGRVGIYRLDDRPEAISAVDFAGALPATTRAPASEALEGEPPLALWIALVLLALVAVEWLLLHRGRV